MKRWLLPRGRDAWLYNRRTLGWFDDPSVQLEAPFRYRAYRACFRLQFPFWGPVFGAQTALRLLNRLPCMHPDRRAVLCVDGARMSVDLADARFLQVPNEIRGGSRVAAVLPNLLGPGDGFIDVGSNYGSMAVLAARSVGARGRLVCIEPNPRVAALLRETLHANVSASWELHEVGCGADAGSDAFFLPRSSSGAGGFVAGYSRQDRAKAVRLPVVRLDDLVDHSTMPTRTVVKIDVEGFEVDVLRGARRLLSRAKPVLLLEINPEALQSRGAHPSSMHDELLSAGYRSFRDLRCPDRLIPLVDLDFDRHRDILIEVDSGSEDA